MTLSLRLKQFTPARVGLGRTGSSLPTRDLLDLALAQARARDAVYAPFDTLAIEKLSTDLSWQIIRVGSAARDRAEFLRRPDLGRRLAQEEPAHPPQSCDLLFVVADGLAPGAACHAAPFLAAAHRRLTDWVIGPLVIAEQARVALGDRIGQAFGASLVAVLIGERPGLSAPSSLGLYLTWNPLPDRSDAERNCLSNIRPDGFPPAAAAAAFVRLANAARRLRLTGISLRLEGATRDDPAILI